MSAALLTPEQVAKRLAVSRTTVWRLMKSGALPSVSIAGSIRRVDESDLDRWIESRRQRSAPASVVPLQQWEGRP